MLILDNIKKDYCLGGMTVKALRGVSFSFRDSEFVAILGPSGCGKTTLLNIIGGLDRYTEGDISINGRSTRDFKDADWDSYRNHSIGFVFQNYNLITHQSVLNNVELALTLSGVGKNERRRRAKEALERVGLGDQLNKKPNQMSGGQMQRVAIARALVNDPDILLADEPTGALDTETSVQIMEILKDIAKTKLVIMVTHNPELAERYATRTIRLLDGRVISDSSPFTPAPDTAAFGNSSGKTSMSFFTALSLSMTNLLTKKTRTLLTAFAGSIGIIGIALILSLSNGIQNYINRVQEDTLSSYPIVLESETYDTSALIASMIGVSDQAHMKKTDEELGSYIYLNEVMYELYNSATSVESRANDLTTFKKFLETPDSDGVLPMDGYASAIRYGYGIRPQIYTLSDDGHVVKSDITALMKGMTASVSGGENAPASSIRPEYMTSFSQFSVWEEMLSGDNDELINPLLKEQYDVIYGSWPTADNEVVLIVGPNNQVSDLVLYDLGLISPEEMTESFRRMATLETLEIQQSKWSFEDICSVKLRLVLPADRWQKNLSGGYTDLSQSELGMRAIYDAGTELKISGIIRPSKDATSTMLGGAIGYTTALTRRMSDTTASREIVQRQLSDSGTDVFSGLPFRSDAGAPTAEKIAATVDGHIAALDTAGKAALYSEFLLTPRKDTVDFLLDQYMSGMTREYVIAVMGGLLPEYASMLEQMDDDLLMSYMRDGLRTQIEDDYIAAVSAQLASLTENELAGLLDSREFTAEEYALLYENCIPSEFSDSSLEANLAFLGYTDPDSPTTISIYASTFAAKDEVINIINAYNDSADEDKRLDYTDYVGLLMSSVTTILNAISYVLVAFVSISLIVSSIMIGIITYISVLERTKEIGILRSIGASKRDIARVFNAETLIVGLCAGLIGIGCTVLLNIPISLLARQLTGIGYLTALLPPAAGIILVLISMTLTLTAGLIPSRIASKKDPVEALRTE